MLAQDPSSGFSAARLTEAGSGTPDKDRKSHGFMETSHRRLSLAYPKTINPSRHELPTEVLAPPFSFPTNLFLTADPLKCR